MKTLTQFLENVNTIRDVSDRKQSGGQLGSNPGGIYTSPSGKKSYMKFYRNPEQAKSEVASSHVYHAVGVPTLNPELVTHNGKLALTTNWRDDLSPTIIHTDPHQTAKHLVAAILTKNWDAIGLEHGQNTMHDKNGSVHSVDLGGTMRFRAQGGPKEFGPDISELDSLRQKHLPSGQVFGSVTNAQVGHVARNTHIDHASLTAKFKALGLQDAEDHASSVVGRLKALQAL